MTQEEYSSLAREFIESHHPAFLLTVRFKEDSSFDCSIKSKRGLLELWIATYDKEITIGFEDQTGECTWHTHMS